MDASERAELKPIEALLPFLDRSDGESEPQGVPWHGDDRLRIAAHGGLVSRERHTAVLAREAYTDSVAGDARMRVSGDYERNIDEDALLEVENGADTIDVEGDAAIEFDERMVRMSGTIQRTWTGPITRMAGMEGVICGGAYTKVHAAPSMTVCALTTGDVYGACVRFAGARVHVAGLHYRAAKAATWSTGAYVRSAATVVEPLIGSPSQNGPAKSLAGKAARIMNLAGAVLPFVDIAMGVVALPVGIAMLIAGIVRKKQPVPPSGPPRVRMRNGMRVVNAGLELHT